MHRIGCIEEESVSRRRRRSYYDTSRCMANMKIGVRLIIQAGMDPNDSPSALL